MTSRPSDTDFAMPSLRLDGRVALVTGGSRGIGLGIALALAHAGADVALVSRTASDLDRASQMVQAIGRRVLAVPADMTSEDAPVRVVEHARDHFGRLDIVVHAAGINVRQPAVEFSREQFAQVMRVNVESGFFLAQAAAPVMRAQGHGRFIAVTSVATKVALPNVSVYSMSKSALGAMVRALAIEWAKDGVTVNAIAPGRFWTAMTDAVFSDPELHESAVSVIPQARPGIPADLAGAAVLLASDASSYITGQTLFVDGGWTASAGVRA
jgi:NAD(P)-dependent dehydrogenase (short-subunit alcohol dehydrogenase family)